MIASAFTRTGCTLSDKFVTYATLKRHYVCNKCGGQIVNGFDESGDWAKCAECGSVDFISERQFDREIVEAWEVERGLPKHLRALLGPKEEPVSFEKAVQDLYG